MNHNRTYLNSHWSWYLFHPWVFVSDFIYLCRDFCSRGSRGYADCDVWNFNDYLNDIMAGGLKQLSEGMSYPGIGEMDTWEKWQKALKINAERFENVRHYEDIGWENDKDYKKAEQVYAEQEKALKFVMKYFRDLWD